MASPAPDPLAVRLLFVTTTLGFGGAETQVVSLAQGLARRGWTPAVASMIDDGPLEPELRASGIAVYGLGMSRGVPDPRGVFRLARVVRTFRPDIVHSQMVHANLLSRMTRLVAPMPALVCTAQNADEEGKARELAYRLTDSLGDVLTNVSAHATDRYARLRLAPRERLLFVPNGIDVTRFQPDAAARARLRNSLELGDSFTWLTVGRLDVQKDYATLIASFALHAAAHPESLLLVAGDGPHRAQVEADIAARGLGRRVRLLGLRSDIPDLMRAADAFLLTSRWEGLPVAVLEASASGLPVVATAVGGTDEIVRPPATGRLAPVGDPSAIAAGMNAVAGMSPGDRLALGAAAREHVTREFGLEHVLDRWEEVYRDVRRK